MRTEKTIATVLEETRKKAVEEAMDAFEEGLESFYGWRRIRPCKSFSPGFALGWRFGATLVAMATLAKTIPRGWALRVLLAGYGRQSAFLLGSARA